MRRLGLQRFDVLVPLALVVALYSAAIGQLI